MAVHKTKEERINRKKEKEDEITKENQQLRESNWKIANTITQLIAYTKAWLEAETYEETGKTVCSSAECSIRWKSCAT